MQVGTTINLCDQPMSMSIIIIIIIIIIILTVISLFRILTSCTFTASTGALPWSAGTRAGSTVVIAWSFEAVSQLLFVQEYDISGR